MPQSPASPARAAGHNIWDVFLLDTQLPPLYPVLTLNKLPVDLVHVGDWVG